MRGTFDGDDVQQCDQLPGRTVRAYNCFRHGPGAFKIDFAIEGHVPWTAAAALEAGTVHLGGGAEEIAEAITAQIERFAPGFREQIVGTAVRSTTEMSAYNPNYVGGDIIGGASTLRQLLFRPRLRPTRTSRAFPAPTCAPLPHHREQVHTGVDAWR